MHSIKLAANDLLKFCKMFSIESQKKMSHCRTGRFRTFVNVIIAGSFRVSLFIDLMCPWNLGKRSGCFVIDLIRWPISWFVCQWCHVTTSRHSNVNYVHDVIFCILSDLHAFIFRLWEEIQIQIDWKKRTLWCHFIFVCLAKCHWSTYISVILGSNFFIIYQ